MKRKLSFKGSKRLPEERMTLIGEIAVPAVPGTSYHAILCGLIDYKNKFVTWNKIASLVEEYLIMFGGEGAWKKFTNRKTKNKEYILDKIKTNTNMLTKTGKKSYGYRLHERGIVIYYFKDGAMARTGGKFIPAKGRKSYNVRFHDGTGIQLRTKGELLSYREFKDIMGNNWYEEADEDIII